MNYAERAEAIITKLAEVRIRLINIGHSRNSLTVSQCQDVLDAVENMETDIQFADFIATNYKQLYKMAIGSHCMKPEVTCPDLVALHNEAFLLLLKRIKSSEIEDKYFNRPL